MGWVSRFVALVLLWSMLLGEVSDRHLLHLNCRFIKKGLPSPLCFCGTAGEQMPHQYLGVCVTWPQGAYFPRSRSPCGSACWLMVLPKQRISWLLSVTFHVTMFSYCIYLYTFFLSSPCFSPNTTCLVAPLSGLAQDRVQSKNNPWPCLAVLRGIKSCFFP